MQKNTKNKEKIFNDMPHSLEAEQSLLGCVLMDPIVQSEIGSQISEEDFYSESHKYIFGAMESIIKENKALDLVTLADALEKRGELETVGGIEYINQLTNVLPSSANYGRYIEIVRPLCCGLNASNSRIIRNAWVLPVLGGRYNSILSVKSISPTLSPFFPALNASNAANSAAVCRLLLAVEPNSPEAERSTSSITVSSLSSTNFLTYGVPIRAETFQSIARTSSSVVYSLTSSNSMPLPLNTLR